MGVAGDCCCLIVEEIVPGIKEKKERERLRIRQEEERNKKIEEERKKEEQKKKFCAERERNDIKILDNIENLEPKYTDLYKPLPPNKNAKLFEKKPFMKGTNEIRKVIKTLEDFDNFVIKIDEDKYGIMYSIENFDKKFLDIYDCLTQKFLYRITDIKGESIKYFFPLKDGTFYF